MLHVFLECIFVAFCQGEDLIISSIFKVDFGDFQFMRIEPKAVQYLSGVATTLLGSGGLCTIRLIFFFLKHIIVYNFFQVIWSGFG
jgi:hypothetical protein